MITIRFRWLLPVVALAAAAFSGCNRPAAVLSGNVTYEGQPIESGTIDFLPEDGKGPSCGSPIDKGAYHVEVLTPGKKMVHIIGVKHIDFSRSPDEMAGAAKTTAATADATGIIDRADTVPADAVGNNVVVDIGPGDQTRNFPLTKPAGK